MTSLDKRMKDYEKSETGRQAMKLLPVYARIDGKSFSNLTKDMDRPYDLDFLHVMDETAKFLIEHTEARIAYTQSDEINLVWFSENYDSQIMFDGKIHKLNSVLAAMASVKFNHELAYHFPHKAFSLPVFDCRVFNLPNLEEAANALVWRELDATRNSISMATRSYYSHNQTYKKNDKEKQDMLFDVGVNWNDFPERFKRGAYFRKITVERKFNKEELDLLPHGHEARKNPNMTFTRTEICRMDIPFITSIDNKSGVLFNREFPKIKED